MAELSVRLLALLGKMADKGDEEDVHKLRTTVRRLEVQLGQCPSKIAKSLKSLRRKAGKVRDVDVHLGLLRSSLFTGPAAAPNAAAVCDKLRRALESERERHVEALLRVVEDAAPLLEALNAGAIDTGYGGDAPFIFAIGSNAQIRAIGAQRYDGSGPVLVVRADAEAETKDISFAVDPAIKPADAVTMVEAAMPDMLAKLEAARELARTKAQIRKGFDKG